MKNIIYLLLLLLPLPASSQTDLVINEILVRNASAGALDAENGYNFNSWVEVYNPTSNVIELNQYTFSKTTKSGERFWTPGAVKVPAGGYAVLNFERQDSVYYRGDVKYAIANKADLVGRTSSFKLDSEGGNLKLSKGGAVIDVIAYPEQYRNASYGRTGTFDDGEEIWGFFATPTKSAANGSNYVIIAGFVQTSAPTFSIPAGFYSGTQSVTLTAEAGSTIYYTITDARTDKKITVVGGGTEPTTTSTVYSAPISVSGQSVIRAIAVAPGKLPSVIATSTYLVGVTKPSLPVIALTVEDRFMYDAEVGMYDVDANGDGNADSPAGNHPIIRAHDGALNANGAWITQGCNRIGNYNQPWDRPANFEVWDKDGNLKISQEVDIAVAGQCTRQNTFMKSFKVKAKDKLGNDKLDYDFFASKPNHKYESVMLRFAGTEGAGSMNGVSYFRDALMSTLAIGYMEVDVQAYQPAVIFLNGEYWGIVNIRERSNDSNIYSSYGIGGDDVYVVENSEMFYPAPKTSPELNTSIPFIPYEKKKAFDEMFNQIADQDMSDPVEYAKACELLDIDNYIDLLLLSVYGKNWDWPQNNQKLWRPVAEGGKWRYFAYDNDFALDNGAICGSGWNDILNPGCDDKGLGGKFKGLLQSFMKSSEFKARLLARAEVHAQTTFKPERLTAMVDSFKNQLNADIPAFVAYRSRSDFNWAGAVTAVRNYVNGRTSSWLTETKNFFSSSTVPVKISASIPQATVKLNGQTLPKGVLTTVNYASDCAAEFAAAEVSGYKFKHWQHTPTGDAEVFISKGDTWSWYGFNKDRIGGATATAWRTDTSAFTGIGSGKDKPAPLGFGSSGVNDLVQGKGTVATRIAPKPFGFSCPINGAYFVKPIEISDLSDLGYFQIWANVDDVAAFYVNGEEVYRAGFGTDPNYPITTRTLANTTLAAPFSFMVDKSKFVQGTNWIAVEVHQAANENGNGTPTEADCNTNVDLYFDMQLTALKLSTAYDKTESLAYSREISSEYETQAVYEVCSDCNPKAVRINEVYAASPSDETGDWIDIYNGENTSVDVGGYYIIRYNDGNLASSPYYIPDGTRISSSKELNLTQDDFGFGISYDHNYYIVLFDKYNAPIDTFKVDDKSLYTVTGQSVVHANNDGTGPLEISNTPDPGPGLSIPEVEVARELIVTVYPNPVEDELNIATTAKINSVTVSSISGNVLIRRTDAAYHVSTQGLPKGVYIVAVDTEAGRAVKKIIKK
ncbi:MAG: CotH kinase family protein [Dysgonamonadaceae bacterium]|jgi:hypothetical protein|nr:CotH kinase family protein [Dysgonamonadaceae bacterium]